MDTAAAVYRNQGRTPEELAGLLNVNTEELLEALQTLSLCGLPPYGPGDLFDTYIENGRVYIHHPYGLFDRPVRLSRTEGLALLVACRAAGSAVTREPAIESALKKVQNALRPDKADELKSVSERFNIAPETANLRPLLDTLRAASGHMKVQIEYFTPARGKLERRSVRPYGLIYNVEYWYLVGWCEKREEIRVFRVDRIRSAQRTGEKFSMPPDFDLDVFRTERMFKYIERPFKVRLRQTARRDGEKRQTTEQIEFNVDRLENFVGQVLKRAGVASVVEPPELRSLVRRAVSDTLKHYPESGLNGLEVSERFPV